MKISVEITFAPLEEEYKDKIKNHHFHKKIRLQV